MRRASLAKSLSGGSEQFKGVTKWTVQGSSRESQKSRPALVKACGSSNLCTLSLYETHCFGCFELGVPSLEAKSLQRVYWNCLRLHFLSQPPRLIWCLSLLIISPLLFLFCPLLSVPTGLYRVLLLSCLYWCTSSLIRVSDFNIPKVFFKGSPLLPC